MAKVREGREPDPVIIHEDEPCCEDGEGASRTEALDDSRGPLEESGSTNLLSDESDDEAIQDSVAADILKFEQSFGNVSKRYRFINRIGEGRHLKPKTDLRCLTYYRHFLHGL